MTIDEAINVLKEHIDTYVTCHGEEDTVAVSLDNVDIEALDMAIKVLEQEPRKGHWMKSNIGGAKVCSVCNAHIGLSSFKFCPNCGADMRGKEE